MESIKTVLETIVSSSEEYDPSAGLLENWTRFFRTLDITSPSFEFEMLINQSTVNKVRQILPHACICWTKKHQHQNSLSVDCGLVDGEEDEEGDRISLYLVMLLEEEWTGTTNAYQYDEDSNHTLDRSIVFKFFDFGGSLQFEIDAAINDVNGESIEFKTTEIDEWDEYAENELLKYLEFLQKKP